MNKLFDRSTKAGFTLVELIVVIAILGILAGVAIPVYNGYIGKAKQASDEALLDAVNTAFAAACLENGNYDMTKLPFGPRATISDDGEVSVDPYSDDFQRYFGDSGTFKHYDMLTFVPSQGVFRGTTGEAVVNAFLAAWGGSSFSSESGEKELNYLALFDSVSDVFGRNANLLSIVAEAAASDPAMKNLLDSMGISGLSAAMNLTEEQLQAVVEANAASLIPGYATMTDEEKAQAIEDKALDLESVIKGNSGVLYVANDAAGRTSAQVRTGTESVIGTLRSVSSGILSDDELDNYLSANVTGYGTMTEEEQQAAKDAYKQNHSMGGITFTDSALNSLQSATSGNSSLSEGGVSSLGALFALTQGFYGSEYYTGEQPSMNGGTNMVNAVIGAISGDNQTAFEQYYTAQGSADIDAYLSAMSVMASRSGDINLLDGSAFQEQYSYISELLGIVEEVED